MNQATFTDHDETLEVLAHVQQDKRGNKLVLRVNPLAAHDLYDELGELLGSE